MDEDDWVCSECHSPVHLEVGFDVPEDHRCWRCKADLFDEAEEMLNKIDILLAPNRRGHRQKGAADKVQDLVMTRRWQISPSAPKTTQHISQEGDK